MIPQNVQVFPSGEVRVFRPDEDGDWLLVGHVRAPEDAADDDLIGVMMADMPPPFEAE